MKAQILEIGDVVRGTLQRRMKVCGKAACRCATDATARHGPYFEWGRLAAGKRTSAVVGAELASRLTLVSDFEDGEEVEDGWEDDAAWEDDDEEDEELDGEEHEEEE